MAWTYNSLFQSFFNTIAAVSTATPIGPNPTIFSSYTDPYWAIEFPNCIDYAENRMYRDLDLLNWRVTLSGNTTPLNRVFSLPSAPYGSFRKLELMNIIGASSDPIPVDVRTPLVAFSRAYLDMAWPANSTWNGMPEVYAMKDDQTVILGPAPDQSYLAECIGPISPLPLSIVNQTTFLATKLPDVFFAAAMVKASAYMRDLGSMSENPQMSVNWEAQYQTLLKTADIEEAGRWYRSAGWTSQSPRMASTPPRS